jgi:hypothetical protein
LIISVMKKFKDLCFGMVILSNQINSKIIDIHVQSPFLL